MDFKLIVAVFISKIIAFLLKILGSGGTAAPGLIALKIDPNLVIKLTGQLDKNILVSGTNGKTTTSRMVATIFSQAKLAHVHNRAGSNLLRGIASTLIEKSSPLGKMPTGLTGLWETDEAVFPITCDQLKPEIVLLTNLFRDQLDRYGEIDTVALGWREALEKLPPTSQIILNADDATVASLGKNLQRFDPGSKKSPIQDRGIAKITYFGLNDKNLDSHLPDHASDATICPRCLSALVYKQCFVGHLGIYHCPKCGQIQPKKIFYLDKVSIQERTKTFLDRGKQKDIPSVIEIKAGNQLIKLQTTLPGTYNLYNFVAAIALASLLKIEKATIQASLSAFVPAFGRIEKIKAKGKILHLYLVKNPTGFNEVINTLIEKHKCHSRESGNLYRFRVKPGMTKKINCLIAINDLIADGRDVSWLWDVNFEKLTPCFKRVIVAGVRAYDMALRLKYTNTTTKQFNNLTIETNLSKAIQLLLAQIDNDLYLLPTYTAMLQTRKILNKMGLVGSSWDD